MKEFIVKFITYGNLEEVLNSLTKVGYTVHSVIPRPMHPDQTVVVAYRVVA